MMIEPFGPILAATVTSVAIFYLFQTLKNSDQLTAQKLKGNEKSK